MNGSRARRGAALVERTTQVDELAGLLLGQQGEPLDLLGQAADHLAVLPLLVLEPVTMPWSWARSSVFGWVAIRTAILPRADGPDAI